MGRTGSPADAKTADGDAKKTGEKAGQLLGNVTKAMLESAG